MDQLSTHCGHYGWAYPNHMRGMVTAFLGVGLVVVLANIAYAVRRRRVMWAHTLTKAQWAEQRYSPLGY
jgi:hypothetical protein